MKKVSILLLSILFITTALGAFSACNPTDSTDEIVVTIGTTMAVENAVRDEYNYDCIATATSEIPLVGKDENGDYYPLAVSYETSDFKTWTLSVVDGLTWSDGTPVTALDVVFSLEYESSSDKPAFSTGEITGTYASYVLSDNGKSVTLVRESASITALDEMAVFRIRPKHIYESNGSLSPSDKRVSCGPYIFSSFDKASSSITFVKNPYYPLDTTVDKVVYKIYATDDALYTALISREIDFAWNYSKGVPADYRKALEKSDEVVLENVPASNCPAMLVFNNSRGLGSDKNVRFAISYALDYEKFKGYFGSAQSSIPNRSFVSSAHKGYKETEKLETNVDKASEYMREAGYTKVGAHWQKNGEKAILALTVNGGNVSHVGYAEFVKTQLDAFGISVVLDVVDKAHYNEKTSHKFSENTDGKVGMESAIMGYTSAGMAGDFGVKYIDGNNSVQGGAEVYSGTLTALSERLSSAKTESEYEEVAGLIQDFYADTLPAIALYSDSLIYARSSRLNGIVLDGNFGLNNAKLWFSITKI